MFCKAKASLPTVTNGMHFPLSLGNGLMLGIPSRFDSSFFSMFEFLKTLEFLDFPTAPTSTAIKQ